MNLSRALSGQLMDVKTLQFFFSRDFLTLSDDKLIFMNCHSQ